MQRYFVESSNIINGYVYINGEDYHHITKVMRMKIDDEIIVCDNQDSYLCKIIEINAECVTSQIFKKLDEKKELPVNVTIAQGVVRREKAEEVIDKITQLGANKYLMVNMERCNVKLNDEKLNKKVDRMNKIAKEASEQSHRTRKLVVESPIDFKNLCTTNPHSYFFQGRISDRKYPVREHYLISVFPPIYGRSASGILTEPSS